MWDGFGSFFNLNLCVVVNAPYHTFKVWGKFTASHFRQSVGQMIDRKNRFCLKSLSSPVVFVVVVVVVARRHRRRALVELMLLFLVEWKHHGRWLWVFLQPWIFVWLWTLPIILSKYGENSEPHIFVKVMDRRWTEKIASVSSRRRRPSRCCHRRCRHHPSPQEPSPIEPLPLPSLLSLLSVVLIVVVVAHRAVPSRRYHREWWWRGAQVWYLASVRNTSH